MNPYELADELKKCVDDGFTDLVCVFDAVNMLRQQADRIAELEKETHSINYTCPNCETYVELFYKTPQIKELNDEENNFKWWISSFEHLKALGGGINDEMEAKLKEMKEKLKKANEK
jgi:threonine synthase